MSYPQRSILAAVTLFFLAPIVAEFLLGDFPATWLPLIIVLAPMYGGGALLIRELTRRSGRGWPTILLLGVAYAIIEEAFTTQTLFNPDIYGMHMHLLSHAWIPALGTGAWWTLFMLNVHAFWSIGVSIALTEGLFPVARPHALAGQLWPLCRRRPLRLWHRLQHLATRSITTRSAPRPRSSSCPLCSSSSSPPLPSSSRPLLVYQPRPSQRLAASPVPCLAPPAFITGIAAFLLGAAICSRRFYGNGTGPPPPSCSPSIWFFLLGWVCSLIAAHGRLCTPSASALAEHSCTACMPSCRARSFPAPRAIALASHVLFLVFALAVVALGVRRTHSALLKGTRQPAPEHSEA
jgi:hypothetical protein